LFLFLLERLFWMYNSPRLKRSSDTSVSRNDLNNKAKMGKAECFYSKWHNQHDILLSKHVTNSPTRLNGHLVRTPSERAVADRGLNWRRKKIKPCSNNKFKHTLKVMSFTTSLSMHTHLFPAVCVLVVCRAIRKSFSAMGPAVCSHSPWKNTHKVHKNQTGNLSSQTHIFEYEVEDGSIWPHVPTRVAWIIEKASIKWYGDRPKIQISHLVWCPSWRPARPSQWPA
jgi:hypothetical protein